MWDGGGSYQVRVAALQSVTFDYRLVADQTVLDDGETDRLTGSAGIDWFFANATGTGVLDEVIDQSGQDWPGNSLPSSCRDAWRALEPDSLGAGTRSGVPLPRCAERRARCEFDSRRFRRPNNQPAGYRPGTSAVFSRNNLRTRAAFELAQAVVKARRLATRNPL